MPPHSTNTKCTINLALSSLCEISLAADHPSTEEQSGTLALTLIAGLCCILSSRLGMEREIDRESESTRDFYQHLLPTQLMFLPARRSITLMLTRPPQNSIARTACPNDNQAEKCGSGKTCNAYHFLYLFICRLNSSWYLRELF